jgi:hypothetical protein
LITSHAGTAHHRRQHRPGRIGLPAANWFADPAEASMNIPFVQQSPGADGTIIGNEVMLEAVPAMLDELLKLQAALQPLRA